MKRRDLIKSASLAAIAPFLPSLTSGMSEIEENKIRTIRNNIERFGDGRDWFFERRYGVFVHWGLYSIPGWH